MTRPWTCCAVVLLLLSAAAAEEWPQFRGPTGEGLAEAKNLPITWSATENVAWKQELPGNGWSSPIIVNSRVYLTTAVPVEGSEDGDLSLRTLCLDASNGEIIWNVEVFQEDGSTAPSIHSKNSHASPTPLWDKGQLFVHFGHQGTARLDLDGNIVWKRVIEYDPRHGNGGSPVMVGKALIFSVDGMDKQFIIAMDRDSGETIWQTPRNTDADRTFSFSTPLVITVDGKQQVVSCGSDVVAAFDPASGTEIWRVKYDGFSVVPRPIYGHGLVYISTGYHKAVVMAIDPTGEGDVTETNIKWEVDKGGPKNPSLLLVGQELYMVSDQGIASCVDALTGELHWRERLGGNYSASPLFADGKLYFVSEDGNGTVVQADKEFKQLGSNPLEERSLASPAVYDDALFIRTADHLYRFQQTAAE